MSHPHCALQRGDRPATAPHGRKAEATVVQQLCRDCRLCCNYKPGPELGNQNKGLRGSVLLSLHPNNHLSLHSSSTDKSTSSKPTCGTTSLRSDKPSLRLGTVLQLHLLCPAWADEGQCVAQSIFPHEHHSSWLWLQGWGTAGPPTSESACRTPGLSGDSPSSPGTSGV